MRWSWSRDEGPFGGVYPERSRGAQGKLQTKDEKGFAKVASAKETVRCPLCGKSFHPGEAAQCGGCPLATRCGLVMCPNCSYEFAV